MGAIQQVMIGFFGADGGGSAGGVLEFEFWANGQPVIGDSDGTMAFWADGQQIVVEED